MGKKVFFIGCLILLMGFLLLSKFHPEKNNRLIDMDSLRKNGEDWQIIKQETRPRGGSIRLIQDKWLMYFLHWRPLTKKNQTVSNRSVKQLLLSFWGPDMPFTIIGEGGETRVAGHEAWFIDGTIYNGMIHTRFIVWNCPQTKRQFVSDCNINVGKGTPKDLLSLQFKITSTICCHGGCDSIKHHRLTQKFLSKKYNLSFAIPENWRTHEFNYKKWFPGGLTATNGTLWTLLTDSDKYVELLWDDKNEKITKQLFYQYTNKMEGRTYNYQNTIHQISKLEMNNIDIKDGYVIGEGSFTIHFKVKDQQDKEHEIDNLFSCSALLWKTGKKTCFLLAGIISRETFWGMPVDLRPTKKVFQTFLHTELLPSIKAIDKKITPSMTKSP